MLTLLLLRHAKSSWDDTTLDDFDRPLNKRGTKAATLIGTHIASHALIPDLVLCSTAVRTRATLALVLNELPGEAPRVVYDQSLYLAEADTLLQRLRAVEPHKRTVLLVGHNPGIHALALELTGNGPRADLQALAMQFPTAALAHLSFDADNWRRIAPASGTLVEFVSPRRLS